MNTTFENTDSSPSEPEQMQRETEAIREDLDRTLNALESKLSPGQLFDRSLTFMHANGGDLLQKIGATVNKNPLPLLVTSAGLIWLLASTRSSASPRRSAFSSSAPRSGDFDRSAQSFSSSADTAVKGIKQRTQRALDTTRERASHALSATRERTHELGGNINGMVSEQPLVFGAIALAIGAIVGAAFPASAYERNLVARARNAGGEMLDDMKTGLNDAMDDSEKASQPH